MAIFSPAARHIALSIFFGALAVQAQVAASPEAPQYGWRHKGAGILNLSQTYLDNWTKGGTDALTWVLNLSGNLDLERPGYLWENKGRILYGRTELEDQGSRKTSDEWRLESIFTHKLGAWINPFAAAAAWSQFTAGYAYHEATATQPAYRVLTSEFFDPAYLTQTVGAGTEPLKDLKERLGFSVKETFSAEHGYANDPGTGEVDEFRAEFGLSSVTEYQATFMQNVLASTLLDVFVNFDGVDAIDGRWENKVTAKVNKYLSMNLEFDLLYDKDQSDSRQLRESLAIGITFLTL